MVISNSPKYHAATVTLRTGLIKSLRQSDSSWVLKLLTKLTKAGGTCKEKRLQGTPSLHSVNF